MGKKKTKSKPKQSKKLVIPIINNTINKEDLAVALQSLNQPVLLKMCRLCESTDGPFLNIFDPDKITAQKVQSLMPFNILENDDLPHKICFRCSAKVEELHEFVEKCVKAQESLRAVIGKNRSVPKTKIRTQWEEKLNKSNISNDDICNALIKKAMESIKDIPMNSLTCNETKSSSSQVSSLKTNVCINSTINSKKECPGDPAINEKYVTEPVLKNIKVSLEKCDSKPDDMMCLRAKNHDCSIDKNTTCEKVDVTENKKNNPSIYDKVNIKTTEDKSANSNTKVSAHEPSESNLLQKKDLQKPTPFNIMDHITTIKVNGVGVLFQCKLCNRNFLKKEVVEAHHCARNGFVKQNIPKALSMPEPPKASNSVKYIDSKRTSEANKNSKYASNPEKECENISCIKNGINIRSNSEIKRKIGPASRVKRDNPEPQSARNQDSEEHSILPSYKTNTKGNTTNPNNLELPAVSFPTIPSLRHPYKLISGVNNSLTLVVDPLTNSAKSAVVAKSQPKKSGLKRKANEDHLNENIGNVLVPVVIDSDDDDKIIPSSSKQQPYPVGLFSTRPHSSSTPIPSTNAESPKITSLKKQSYSVVQTGNPSKLVISTKQIPLDDNSKVWSKKMTSHAAPAGDGPVKEPFSVTLEDVAPNKDPNFFTFINVDPLLQPSYVLPTDNIIQESQISTSTPAIPNKTNGKEEYQCGICNVTFSREKKLLTHMTSHSSKLDEEEHMAEGMNIIKKKKRKSR